MVDGMNLKEVLLHHICEGCVKGKHQRTSFPKDGATRASQLLEIVHTDVCGPMKTTSHGGARYFLTFIDKFSRKTHVVRERVENGEVRFEYCPTEHMVADVLTKALSKERHHKLNMFGLETS